MQKIIIEKPYEFIPPMESNFWPSILQLYLPRYLRQNFAIHSVECRHVERLQASLQAGHGTLLAPNHCRLSDPLVLGQLVRVTKQNFYFMASWHLFHQNWFTTFLVRRTGSFSVFREGLDRAAINTAVDILAEAKRPLVLFPEGVVSRHNDILMALLDGTAMIARTAAKRRSKTDPPGKVAIHPTAIRYYFHGDVEQTLKPALDNLEQRLTWQRQRGRPLVERLRRIGEALVALKEIEYFGQSRDGDLYERVEGLIDHLMVPLEEEWNVNGHESNIVSRVKTLRAAILPDMLEGQLSEQERERRWRQLTDIYLAQQMVAYPRNYVRTQQNIKEHLVETVEKFEEDLTDEVRYYGPMHAVIEVGEAIEATPERVRRKGGDPIMTQLREQLVTMLDRLRDEAEIVVSEGAPPAGERTPVAPAEAAQ